MTKPRFASITNPLWLSLLGLLIGLAGALAAYGLGRSLRPPQTLRGAMLSPPSPAVDFRLQGDDGRNYSLYDFPGQPILLAFSCLDCTQNHNLLKTLADTVNVVNGIQDTPQVLVVNIGPEDQTEFNRYVQSYHPDFIGLTGEAGEIRDLAHSYDVYYSTGEGDTQFEVIPLIMLIDNHGIWRAIYPLALSAEDIVQDIEILAAEG